MRVLIDITHPAHLHFFRHAIAELRSAGHELLLTAREKDCLHDLAAQHGLRLESFGGEPAGTLGKARLLAGRKWKLLQIVRRFRPDVMTAIGGTFIGFVGFLTRAPTIVFTDTESATLSNALTFPFASRICVPRAYRGESRRQVRYDGSHELAYLRPPRFKPASNVRSELGLRADERFSLVRFVGWQAGHDIGRRGLSPEQKIAAVQRLAELGRVLISCEGPLPSELEPFHFPLPAARIHDALSQASLLLGESSTMSLEAAALGVPSVFIYPRVELGIVREHADRWQIIHWHTPEDFSPALAAATSILNDARSDHWCNIAAQIHAASIDVSEFICRQVLSYARAA